MQYPRDETEPSPYPVRPPGPAWIRYACEVFGLVCAGQGLVTRQVDHTIFAVGGGILIGGLWFSFGAYGGLPLVNTVNNWRPAGTPDEINEMHREGLRVIRRRKWATWAAIPAGLLTAAALMPLLTRTGQPEIILLVLFPPLVIINAIYVLSRCPRCG